jgi:hypothetical protein
MLVSLSLPLFFFDDKVTLFSPFRQLKFDRAIGINRRKDRAESKTPEVID